MRRWKAEPYEGGLRQGNAYWMARISELAYMTKGKGVPDDKDKGVPNDKGKGEPDDEGV